MVFWSPADKQGASSTSSSVVGAAPARRPLAASKMRTSVQSEGGSRDLLCRGSEIDMRESCSRLAE